MSHKFLFNFIELKDNGLIFSFGENDYGELGLGDKVMRNTPTQISNVNNVQQIAIGASHSIAKLSNQSFEVFF